ncbi:MAG: hypothetical protein V8Q30_14270 [Acutalibacteraceae bacterium]
MFRFLLKQFFALTAYTRLILLGSLFLAVVCLFLVRSLPVPCPLRRLPAPDGPLRMSPGSRRGLPGRRVSLRHNL